MQFVIIIKNGFTISKFKLSSKYEKDLVLSQHRGLLNEMHLKSLQHSIPERKPMLFDLHVEIISTYTHEVRKKN